MDRNPEFAQVLNNPQQLQEAMQAAANPVSYLPKALYPTYVIMCYALHFALWPNIPVMGTPGLAEPLVVVASLTSM